MEYECKLGLTFQDAVFALENYPHNYPDWQHQDGYTILEWGKEVKDKHDENRW